MVVFLSWELLWRQRAVKNSRLLPTFDWNGMSSPDSSPPTGRRQVHTLSDFIVLVVCLIILLASMFSGHSKLYSISLTNVSVLEASQGSLSDINTHDIFLPCIYPMWGDSENRGGDLLFNTCLVCGQAKPKCFPLTFVALHAPSAQMLMYSRRGRRHPCVYKDLCVQRLSHPESQLLSSTRK